MIGYKIAKHGEKCVVVTLEIPSDALTNMDRSTVVVKETAMYRTNKANVLKIEDEEGNCYTSATSFKYKKKSLEYKVGEVMEEPSYNYNPQEVCAEGIHYFLSRRVAELYGLEKIKNGLFERWYENGQKWMEYSFVDGNLHGLYQTWHANGQKQEEFTYVNGKMHGLYQIWHANGQIYEETTYINGKKHTFYRRWYENGQKDVETTYVDGQKCGLYQRWYQNGQKMEEHSFVNGNLHGVYQLWHPNGQKWEERQFVYGEAHGLYQRWDTDGNKLAEVTYVNGVRQ